MTSQTMPKNLPDAPGVYFWKQGRKILYVGRATSLRNRVRSYFAADVIATRGPRIVDMVTKATKIDFEKTDSVLEAIILEANLIKKHLPDYNVQEKDDRSFNYVVITKEEFPKVMIVRGKGLRNNLQNMPYDIQASFGPFPNSSVLREALRIIRKMFPYLDEKSLKRNQSAFYRQINLTPETATDESQKEYLQNIRHIRMFFEGKKRAIIHSLTKEMRTFAKHREFEKAAEVKSKIFALNHIRDVSLIKTEDEQLTATNEKPYRIEAYDIAHMSGKESVGVMTVISNGMPDKNEYRKFRISKEIGNNDTASLGEVLNRRFNHPEWRFPDMIVIDGGKGQLNAARKFFTEKKLSALPIIVSVVKTSAHKPRAILGLKSAEKNLEKSILLANAEAHRFAIAYHRKLRQFSKRNLF